MIQPLEIAPVVGPSELILAQRLHPKIRAFVEYWQSIAPAGLLPGRQHLDPAEVPRLLPNIWLVDIERRPDLRFRYRLVGTTVARAFSANPTGRYMDDVHAIFANSAVSHHLTEVVENRAPSWRVGRPTFWTLEEFLRLERVFLPMARDGVNIDLIAALTIFVGKLGREF